MTILEASSARDALWLTQGRRCAVLAHPLLLDQAFLVSTPTEGTVVVGALGGLLLDPAVLHALNTSQQVVRPVELVTLPHHPMGPHFWAQGVAAWYAAIVLGLVSSEDQMRCLSLLYGAWLVIQSSAKPLGRWTEDDGLLTYAPSPQSVVKKIVSDDLVGLWPRSLTILFRSAHQMMESLHPEVPGVDPYGFNDVMSEGFIRELTASTNILEGLFLSLPKSLNILRRLVPITPHRLPWWLLRDLPTLPELGLVLNQTDLDLLDSYLLPDADLPLTATGQMSTTIIGAYSSREVMKEDRHWGRHSHTTRVLKDGWIPYPAGTLGGHHLRYWWQYFVDHGFDEDAAEAATVGLLLGAVEAATNQRVTKSRCAAKAFGKPVPWDQYWREVGWNCPLTF